MRSLHIWSAFEWDCVNCLLIIIAVRYPIYSTGWCNWFALRWRFTIQFLVTDTRLNFTRYWWRITFSFVTERNQRQLDDHYLTTRKDKQAEHTTKTSHQYPYLDGNASRGRQYNCSKQRWVMEFVRNQQISVERYILYLPPWIHVYWWQISIGL